MHYMFCMRLDVVMCLLVVQLCHKALLGPQDSLAGYHMSFLLHLHLHGIQCFDTWNGTRDYLYISVYVS